MRIDQAQVWGLQAPLIQPFRTALGEHKTLDNLLFVLRLADGTKGYGEAAIAPHITGETIAISRYNLKAVGRWLLGKDSRDYWAISGVLHERWSSNPATIAAVETALFDAIARQRGLPLWRLFGSRCRKLQTDITIVIADLDETKETVRRFYGQGFRQFKVKIGQDPDLDIQRVVAVRQLAPLGIIYLDANQGFEVITMLKFLKALRVLKIRPALLEQPIHHADIEGLKRIVRSTDVPVCADESVRSLSDAVTVIRARAASVISIKLMKFGLVQALVIARMAKAAGVKLMISGMLESALAMTASAHLAAGLGIFSFIDLDTPFFVRGPGGRPAFLSPQGVYDLRAVQRGIGVVPRIQGSRDNNAF